MRLIHWRLLLAATLVVAVLVAVVGTTGAQAPPHSRRRSSRLPRSHCATGARSSTRSGITAHARQVVYKRAHISQRATKKLKRMRMCAKSAKAGRNMRHVEYHLATLRRERLELRAVTPFGPCYGGYWAVPCEIIGGESKGNWDAENKYGCKGPYQFCGHDPPWPAHTFAAKLRHHEIAASLWRGGRGCSNWEQTSSQC
jgi:hypothetical protein